jgi:hypothetical protein
MKAKGPDPDGFRELIRYKASNTTRHSGLGDVSEVGRRADDFGLSAEDARGILRRDGWELRPTSSGAGRRWYPPEEEG